MMAGMKEYDVIVKVGEHKVETIKQYHEQLGKYSTGDVVTVTAMRKGAEGYAEMTFDVTMGKYKNRGFREQKKPVLAGGASGSFSFRMVFHWRMKKYVHSAGKSGRIGKACRSTGFAS